MTPVQYLAANKIILGGYYKSGDNGQPLQAVSVVRYGYTSVRNGEYGVKFSDGSSYPMAHPFWWVPCEAPQEPNKVEEVVDDTRKEHDDRYYKAKERHIELCNKKLELNRIGKNTTMRNAYINQELESLRSIIREYKA